MKIKLDKIVTKAVEVDLPDNCPECKADFRDTKACNLLEHEWVADSQYCHIEGDTTEGYTGTGSKDNFDGIYTTGYSCRRCGHTIVTTEVLPEGWANGHTDDCDCGDCFKPAAPPEVKPERADLLAALQSIADYDCPGCGMTPCPINVARLALGLPIADDEETDNAGVDCDCDYNCDCYPEGGEG